MTNLKIQWTQSMRRSLYTSLVTLFGPYEDWTEANPPGLDAFRETFARRHGASNGDAVRLQVDFATTQPKARGYKRASLYALNKAAAFEAGFITRRAAWPDNLTETYEPIACETLLHGFYVNLPHGREEQDAFLRDFVREGFANGMEFDNGDRSRLSIAADGLIHLALALHTEQLHVEGVAVSSSNYDHTIASLDEVRRGFERLKANLAPQG